MKKSILTIGLSLLISSIAYSQQWIVFFAYPANFSPSPGHTYVSFLKRDNVAKQTVVEEIWGFYPEKTSLKAFFIEEGQIKAEKLGTHTLNAEYDFVVEIKDKKVYEICKKVKEIWQSKNYSVVAGQTCVGYMKDVAINIPGVSMPSSFHLSNDWPKDFLLNLKKQNEPIDKASRISLSSAPSNTNAETEFFITKNSEFQFNYSKELKVKASGEGGIILTIPKGRTKGTDLDIIVTFQKVPDDFIASGIENYAKLQTKALDSMQRADNNFRIETSEFLQLNGINWFHVSLKFKVTNKEMLVREYSGIKFDNFCSLRVTGFPSEKVPLENYIETILKSIQFKESNAYRKKKFINTNTNYNSETQLISGCEAITKLGKTIKEKNELKTNYILLLGILEELRAYRNNFILTGSLIDLFPTTYYHTTIREIEYILGNNNTYRYPIEKMKQMIAFYSAYKFNRENWDIGNNTVVEPHWAIHFAQTKIPINCINFGYLLSSAIIAHVEFDLPRAIKFAFDDRFNKSLKKEDLENDFIKTESIFWDTRNNTINDVKEGLECWDASKYIIDASSFVLPKIEEFLFPLYEKYIKKVPYSEYVFPEFLKSLGISPITDNGVKRMRLNAWKNAFKIENSKRVGIDGKPLLSQPTPDVTKIYSIGKKKCINGTIENSNLSKGAALLFQEENVNNHSVLKLSDKDKEDIYSKSKLSLSKDEMQFTMPRLDEDKENPFDCLVELIDLNSDGILEVYIHIASTYFGMQGFCMLFSKIDGEYKEIHSESTHIALSNQMSKGFPDILGRFGFIYRWNGNEYKSYKQDDRGTTKGYSFEEFYKLQKAGKLKVVTQGSLASSKNLIGGKTQEELGIILLKALKSNDKETWIRCIHPKAPELARNESIREFDILRNDLKGAGVSQFNLLEFSRVMYRSELKTSNEDGSPLIQHRDFKIEFYYRNKEFIGLLQNFTVAVFDGKYFIGGGSLSDVILIRRK